MKYVLAIMCSLFVVVTPTLALAADPPPICGESASSAKGQVLYGAKQSGSDCGDGVNKVANTVAVTLSVVVGIVAVIMILVSGFKYITSGGDASKIANAKTTLIYAIVGLVVAGLAQVLVNFAFGISSSDKCQYDQALLASDSKCVAPAPKAKAPVKKAPAAKVTTPTKTTAPAKTAPAPATNTSTVPKQAVTP